MKPIYGPKFALIWLSILVACLSFWILLYALAPRFTVWTLGLMAGAMLLFALYHDAKRWWQGRSRRIR